MKIAVILFPGTNCELETKQALEACGMSADIFRWNLNPEKLEDCDGYVLPGGWSYEDRIRAGAISAKEPIMDLIKNLLDKYNRLGGEGERQKKVVVEVIKDLTGFSEEGIGIVFGF